LIIDDEKKLVFISIAKTASTAIRRRLDNFEDPPPHIYHMFLKDVIDQNPHVKDYFKFAFVRNPYDRLYSTYINLKYDGHPWAVELKQKQNFESFVLDLKGSKYSKYIHLQPQVDSIKYNGGVIDFVGRYENLNSDFHKVEKILNMSHEKLIKIRESSIRPNEPKIYTEQMKQVVCEVYQKDFEEFNYEK